MSYHEGAVPPMMWPAHVQDMVDAVIEAFTRGEQAERLPAYLRLTEWLEAEAGDEIFDYGEHSFAATNISGLEGELTDDEVREDLGLDEDAPVSDADRLEYASGWFQSRLDDADYSPSFDTLAIESRAGRRAFLGYEVTGYSFTGIQIHWHGMLASPEELAEDMAKDGWLRSVDEFERLSPMVRLRLFNPSPSEEA